MKALIDYMPGAMTLFAIAMSSLSPMKPPAAECPPEVLRGIGDGVYLYLGCYEAERVIGMRIYANKNGYESFNVIPKDIYWSLVEEYTKGLRVVSREAAAAVKSYLGEETDYWGFEVENGVIRSLLYKEDVVGDLL